MKYFVHESSYVDKGAQIGEGSKVWHFSHVMPSAQIGKDCSLGQNVYVGPNVVIGNQVKIQNNVSIYEGVHLEDYVFCGPSMVFTNVSNPRSSAPVSTDKYLKTTVKTGATLGANSTIVCGHTIGEWSFIAAGAVITSDVAAYAMMMGVPAKQAGWVCKCTKKLVIESDLSTCKHCGAKYKLISSTVLEDVSS